jgi:hypothetical protein
MISITNKINANVLTVDFASIIGSKSININIENDVDFKPIIEYLIELIPLKEDLTFLFEEDENVVNENKNKIICETLSEIYKKFNENHDEKIIPEEISNEDLPF